MRWGDNLNLQDWLRPCWSPCETSTSRPDPRAPSSYNLGLVPQRSSVNQQRCVLGPGSGLVQVNVYHYGAAMAAYERLGSWQGALDLLSSMWQLPSGKLESFLQIL